MKMFYLLFILGHTLALLEQIESTADIFESEHDENVELEHDISKNTLLEDLKETQDTVKDCLNRNGINTQSFLFCCGHGYEKVEERFIGRYRQLRTVLQNTFGDVTYACEFEKEPCEKLEEDLSRAMHENVSNVYNRMLTSKTEVQSKPGVNHEVLELEFSKFKKNYQVFDKSRNLIADSLTELVNYIIQDIEDSKLSLKVDYKHFNPEKAYRELGIDMDDYERYEEEHHHDEENHFIEEVSEEEHHEHESEEDHESGEHDHEEEHKKDPEDLIPAKESNRFHTNLAKQNAPLQLVNYYLANGLLNKAKVDMTKMPTDVLKEMKRPDKDENKN